jgi:predicted RNA methylase
MHALLAGSAALANLRYWLYSDEEQVRYRFSLTRNVRREALRVMLGAVRAACVPLGLEDSPSNYDLELIVEGAGTASRLLIRPSFMRDERFAYRARDVGGSISPVVAACLARLACTGPAAAVLDPTCGSGTLLIERALLGGAQSLQGIDISPNAVAAAQTNVRAAGLARRIQVAQGDATRAESWPPCDEVLANLPFGLRTGRRETDLPQLYKALLSQIALRLRPSGRAVLYTTNKHIVEAALPAHKARLRLHRHLTVLAGGLWVHVWVIVRNS